MSSSRKGGGYETFHDKQELCIQALVQGVGAKRYCPPPTIELEMQNIFTGKYKAQCPYF